MAICSGPFLPLPVVAGAVLLLAGPLAAQGPIVLDGRFVEWDSATVTIPDAAYAPGAEAGFRVVKASHDDGAVYLLLDLGRPLNVQSLDGSVSILFDADGDPFTGSALHGLQGVDLVVDLPPPYPIVGGPPGIGAGVRLATDRSSTGADAGAADGPADGAFSRHDSYHVGLSFAPKYASRFVELRIDRGPGPLRGIGPAGGVTLFAGDRYTAKLLFMGSDGSVRQGTPPFAYELVGGRPRPPNAGEEDPLARAPGTSFRVLAWNVSRGNLLDRKDRFARVLAAARPDIILLDEAPAGAAEEIADFLSGLPGPDGEDWHLLYGEAGGPQRSVIASGRPVIAVHELEEISYPDSLFERLNRLAGRSRPQGFAGPEAGLPALGGIVELEDARLLVVTLDLQCCGNGTETVEEYLRQVEVAAIHEALTEALARHGGGVDAVIVAGDFNLVGSREPLEAMLRGVDVDGSGLAVAEALQLDGLSNATWDGGAGPFPPARLDFMLFGDASLRLERAFVLDTRDLTGEWLDHHGLRAEDTERASDHLPVVADFSWVRPRP
ncbi:MAG: endonuclease/exonuclease/phosphatase family protein [Gemmatimonadota bacterium]